MQRLLTVACPAPCRVSLIELSLLHRLFRILVNALLVRALGWAILRKLAALQLKPGGHRRHWLWVCPEGVSRNAGVTASCGRQTIVSHAALLCRPLYAHAEVVDRHQLLSGLWNWDGHWHLIEELFFVRFLQVCSVCLSLHNIPQGRRQCDCPLST